VPKNLTAALSNISGKELPNFCISSIATPLITKFEITLFFIVFVALETLLDIFSTILDTPSVTIFVALVILLLTLLVTTDVKSVKILLVLVSLVAVGLGLTSTLGCALGCTLGAALTSTLGAGVSTLFTSAGLPLG
jgi:hypothetical protein